MLMRLRPRAALPSHDPGFFSLKALLRRQSPYSFFVFCTSVILVLTIVLDLLIHQNVIDQAVSFLMLLLTAAVAFWSMCSGARLARWVGPAGISLFALVTIFCLSSQSTVQNSVSSLQELPIFSFYLAWFVRSPLNRVFLFLGVAFFGCAMILNPAFWVGGVLGPAPAVQGALVAVCCFFASSALRKGSEKEAYIDQLTGALNRGAFLSKLGKTLEKATRSRSRESLVVVDFDYFKTLNDTMGHTAGDRALAETVNLWDRSLRSKDLIGRTGGDEFALLLRDTALSDAKNVMVRLRAESKHAWSWGIAEAIPGETAEELFERADAALYGVKRARS